MTEWLPDFVSGWATTCCGHQRLWQFHQVYCWDLWSDF